MPPRSGAWGGSRRSLELQRQAAAHGAGSHRADPSLSDDDDRRQNPNAIWGGERGGANAGGSVGRPRCRKILRTTGGSEINAIRRRREPQLGQVSTSTWNTLRRSSAQE